MSESSVCILTDNTAQFTAPIFPGKDLVRIVSIKVIDEEDANRSLDDLRASEFPASIFQTPLRSGSEFRPKVIPPSVDEFQNTYAYLGTQFEEIVVLLHTSHLSLGVTNAKIAAQNNQDRTKIIVIDSQTTGVGLGLLVQIAVEAISKGASGGDIKRLLWGMIPNVYSVFFVQSLSYLSISGFLGESQAVVGEMLELTPFFVMERGTMIPMQKARSSRHMVDIVYEFISEFNNIEHIAFLQGFPPFEQEVRSLRDRLGEEYPEVPISEHLLNPPLTTFLGPKTLGVFVMEHPDELI